MDLGGQFTCEGPMLIILKKLKIYVDASFIKGYSCVKNRII